MSNNVPKSVSEPVEGEGKKRKVEVEESVEFDDEEDLQYIKESLANQKQKKAHKKH